MFESLTFKEESLLQVNCFMKYSTLIYMRITLNDLGRVQIFDNTAPSN